MKVVLGRSKYCVGGENREEGDRVKGREGERRLEEEKVVNVIEGGAYHGERRL